MKNTILFFAVAAMASTASAKIPTADGIYCPWTIPDSGGDFRNATPDQKFAIHSLWNGTDNGRFAMQLEGAIIPLTDEMVDNCSAHPSVVAANANTPTEAEQGFVNNKTPDGGNGDGKWYSDGVRSFDDGDAPMSRPDAEALGIEIGN